MVTAIKINFLVKIIIITSIVTLRTTYAQSSDPPPLYSTKKSDIKYILQWTWGKTCDDIPLDFNEKILTCSYNNCFLTNDSEFFLSTKSFDAVLFDCISAHKYFLLPDFRSEDQIFIFMSKEPVNAGPSFNRFQREGYFRIFNYTWTYKLDSDIPFNYLTMRNKSSGEVLAPKQQVNWADLEHVAVPDEVRNKLSSKTIAAAWFVSNCKASNKRLSYARKLQDVLKSYNLQLDIYGSCGSLDCPKEFWADCQAKIEKDYYFYLAFEHSNHADYVTEKLLTAVKNYAVPIVYGGADYFRFMPKGSYLDARLFEPELLGKRISELINNKEEYYQYFKWHSYYSYHDSLESRDTNPYCALCAFLNGDWRTKRRANRRFANWWCKDAPPIITDFKAPKLRVEL